MPSTTQCARSWWVRPVRGFMASQLAILAARATTRYAVRALPALLVRPDALTPGTALLGERLVDDPGGERRAPDHQRPVQLVDLVLAKRARELGGDLRRTWRSRECRSYRDRA